MQFTETAFTFECEESNLTGILSLPESPLSQGVLIIVGGPQYRVGSHRQFTLLSRDLAQTGIPCMRFDYRGMGDSEGDLHTFENVNADMRAAVNAFYTQCPGLEKIILWGLCDAASAAVFYAHLDPRICGLVLVNPWVRTLQGGAKTQLKHYYLSRMTNADLWRKLLSGKFKFWGAFKGVFGAISRLKTSENDKNIPLPEHMRQSLEKFQDKILFIMSGNDLVAREFEDAVKASQKWRDLLNAPNVTRRDLPDADHTFSCHVWRDQVAQWTCDWVAKLRTRY